MSKSLLHGEFIIAVDFDGTITTEGDIKDTPLELRPECKRVLTRLVEDADVKLVLWTCRAGSSLDDAIDFLHKEDMAHLFSSINEQVEEINKKYHPDVARKVGADLYIDDKNVFCKEVNWLDIEKYIFGE